MKKLYTVLLALTSVIANLPCRQAGAQAPNWQWAINGQGLLQDYGNSISLDANGNSYATGYFEVPHRNRTDVAHLLHAKIPTTDDYARIDCTGCRRKDGAGARAGGFSVHNRT